MRRPRAVIAAGSAGSTCSSVVFWSFMADLFDREQGKRVFAFIAAGASTGGILGSSIPAFFAEALGDVNLLLISSALLAGTVLPIRYLLRWSSQRATTGERLDERPIGGNPFAGFTRVFPRATCPHCSICLPVAAV